MALTVDLDETSGEANGAAYLVHMLLHQRCVKDDGACLAASVGRLKPVHLTLVDTGDSCTVQSSPTGLRVTSGLCGRPATVVMAESGHIVAVTQLRLLGRVLISGPFRDRKFWQVIGDLIRRRLRVKGLLGHYLNTMRFLHLVNVR
jgi:hypothetical protein